MADPIRIPLVTTLEPRLAGIAKDSVASNLYYDKDIGGVTYAAKRPGITSYIAGLGEALGIFDGFSFNGPSGWGNSTFIWSGTEYVGVSREALPYRNLAISSSDGVEWSQVSLTGVWSAIAWNGTRYVAIGTRTSPLTSYVATSTNGDTWTFGTIDAATWNGIAEDGTTFVAVGLRAGGSAAYSTDGITWSYGNLSAGWSKVAYCSGAGVFCACTEQTTNVVSTSPTGAVWTNRTFLSTDRRFTISANDSLFVTADYNTDQFYRSSDGINWTDTTVSDSGRWVASTWTGTKFVFVDILGAIAISADGITWTISSLPSFTDTSTNYTCVVGNNNEILVFGTGYSGNEYMYSSDGGTTFTKLHLDRWIPIPINP